MAERDERLWDLLEPSTTAVLTMELQNGIVGAGGMLPALLEELQRAGTLDTVRRVCDAARAAGARAWCTAPRCHAPTARVPASNCKIFALADAPAP